MAYKKVLELSADKTVKIGGEDGPTSLEGYFLGTKIIKSKDAGFKDSSLHIFSTEEGNVGVWGTSKLNQLLLTVPPGQMTLITYLGRGPKQKGKQPAYLFQVETDADNITDVSGLKAQNTPVESEEQEVDSSEDDGQEEEAYTPPTKQHISQPLQRPTTDKQAQVAALLAKRK